MGIKDLMRTNRNPYLMVKSDTLGRQTEYFAQETIDFIQSLGKYADNHYRIQIQKWGEEVETIECRIEDSFDEEANLKRGDDWKHILFYEPLDNITVGMYAWFEDNTWLGFNTRNIARLTSSLTVRRCDSVLNFRDEFNNVTAVPIVFDRYNVLNSTMIEKSNQPASLISGHKNAWAQYNEYTATMKTNDRFIINGQAWTVRGIDTVDRRYTNDRDSVHMMAFVLMRSEERVGDDLENDIADADSNIWEIASSTSTINATVGESGTIQANLLHNGEVETDYSILFTSNDESVLTVDEDGNYTAIAEGEATITCTFEKNESIILEIGATVSAASGDTGMTGIVFDSVEAEIAQYEYKTITATFYVDGEVSTDDITFETSGISKSYYSITETTSNSITLWCNAPYTKDKLTITAKAEADGTEYTNSMQIALVSAF